MGMPELKSASSPTVTRCANRVSFLSSRINFYAGSFNDIFAAFTAWASIAVVKI
jgi:hypothetical protein